MTRTHLFLGALLGSLVCGCLGMTAQDLQATQTEVALIQAATMRLSSDGGPSAQDIAAARADQRGALAETCGVLRRGKVDAGACP